jgi:hypothetical protein
MQLAKLIERLQKLEEEHGGDLEVFAIHGASGVSQALSNPYFADDGPSRTDGGPLCEYEAGRGFIWIYEGN